MEEVQTGKSALRKEMSIHIDRYFSPSPIPT